MKKKDIDRIDLEILSVLSKEADITNKSLAERIGLSAPPTLARVKNLRDKGVIKRTDVSVNLEYLGFEVNTLVILTVFRESLEAAKEMLSTLPWVRNYSIAVPNEVLPHVRVFCWFRAPDKEAFAQSTALIGSLPGILHAEVIELQSVEPGKAIDYTAL
jgi:DNA-binding Lrp family transcriptional regulator